MHEKYYYVNITENGFNANVEKSTIEGQKIDSLKSDFYTNQEVNIRAEDHNSSIVDDHQNPVKPAQDYKTQITNIGSFVYASLKEQLTLNEQTFLERFSTFIAHSVDDSFYEMPKTPEGRKRELGRAGWTLLHNIGIKYPHSPTYSQKHDIKTFLSLFGKLFPCAECSPHFQKMISKHPPNFDNNESFNRWLVKIHNIVNKRIGNRIFDYQKLFDRWDCGCRLDSFE
ncbi:FAD-linked sulfhydryl oxidase ERV1 [Cucumispora dikerogammari]|nr:FAD-linked sulfhydryl oxidase ERV1 [Cucumispora dikerogammari]